MFVDASALVAILLREPDRRMLLAALDPHARRFTSPLAIYETVAAIMRQRGFAKDGAELRVARLLTAANIVVVEITEEIGRAALDAFDRYGKGRGHPAQLNMGDCFSYAAARVLAVPLLYKGEDFATTELG
ncbi:MAG: type II toxin-antitoxin system VapC family toxin [Rhizobiales bacterium]|nr:type II toxin-antitoxin system VapC family toxin [Hyphomicrobiales bacterium]